MSDHITRALAAIDALTDVDALLTMARNAKVKSPEVERAALRRLATLLAKHAPGSVEHAAWAMVHTVEATRRLSGAKAWRMNRMRRKIDKDGEVAALEYCALKETAGFAEVLAYGMPELTAEALVLRHATHFSEAAKVAARHRLGQAGFLIDEHGQIS